MLDAVIDAIAAGANEEKKVTRNASNTTIVIHP
jgi:hypothetical protein